MTELSVSVSEEDREEGLRVVVRLTGAADVSARALPEVLAAAAAKKPRLLLVDVSGLRFIDSAALQEIVRVHRKLHADGCLLTLVGPTGAVARILELSGIDQVIPVHSSAADYHARLPARRSDRVYPGW